MTKSSDIIQSIFDEADKQASDLAITTEGNFSPSDIEGIYENAYKAIFHTGIKEVVAWIKSHSQLERCDHEMAYFSAYYTIDKDEWQAKLKEWEI